MAYVILNLVCVAALVGIDQAIKLWATQYLAPVEAITVIPHVVELRFVLNQGMAFSLLSAAAASSCSRSPSSSCWPAASATSSTVC